MKTMHLGSSEAVEKAPALLICLTLWVLTAGYVLLLPTRHYTPDAVNNLLFIEQQNTFELWHSQHLLAQWPAFWLYRLGGGAIRAWEAMRLAHSLLAGVTVALVYATLALLTGQRRAAILGSLTLWFSYGFWHYQSDPDIYSAGYAAVALVLFTFVVYLRAPSTRRAFVLGCAGALAILTHQLNLELAVLIGLVLLWMAWTKKSQRASKHLITYTTIPVLLVLGFYMIGWVSATRYLTDLGGEPPLFTQWALGYFAKAQRGDATWGGALNLNHLPLAGYTFLLSWVLPPLVTDISAWSGLLLTILAVSLIFLVVGFAASRRQLSLHQRLVALVCGATLVANSVSGWWWQPGNAKFYLFMQISLIVLLALFMVGQSAGRWRKVGLAAPAAAFVCLILYHLTITLPYETRGGVFAVGDLVQGKPALVGFDTALHAAIFNFTQDKPGDVLPGDFCNRPPQTRDDRQLLWVVNLETAANCPALANATQIGTFQADRSRAVWGIFRMDRPASSGS